LLSGPWRAFLFPPATVSGKKALFWFIYLIKFGNKNKVGPRSEIEVIGKSNGCEVGV
jgi:hypothetical protein